MNSSGHTGVGHCRAENLPGRGGQERLAPLGLQQVKFLLFAGVLLFGSASLTGAQNPPTDAAVTVRISKETVALAAGEWVEFDTVLRNDGAAASPSLAAHLSVAALDSGLHVDPEDWSPRRTQFLPPLQPGQSVRLTWKVHALFEGAFATFVTAVSAQESFPPAVSAPLQLRVAPDNILPLKDVILVAAAVPLLPLALLAYALAHGRRRRGP